MTKFRKGKVRETILSGPNAIFGENLKNETKKRIYKTKIYGKCGFFTKYKQSEYEVLDKNFF